MATEKAKKPTYAPGLHFTLNYFVLLAVNMAVIYAANMFYPNQVVLGTMSVSPLWALCLASGKLAMVGVLTMPFFSQWELMRGKELAPQHWLGGYLIINIAALWAIARFADVLGMGLSSWMVAVVLGAVIDFAQGTAMMGVGEVLKTDKK